jgi:hypothetical protein
MTGSPDVNGCGKAVVETAPSLGASGSVGGGKSASSSAAAAAATGSADKVSEMMGRLRLTAAEAAPVVLDDGADDFQVHSPWAIVGKVLAPNTLHISTIVAALRPAWGNPRGLVLNPAGDNRFVAEFGSKADKSRVVDGPPWVVGKHAVLLRDFDIDQRPSDMTFNGLKIWARIINLPFGYMHKKWGEVIAGSLGIEGSTPVVDCDNTGRCWGSYMRVRVELNVDKPLLRESRSSLNAGMRLIGLTCSMRVCLIIVSRVALWVILQLNARTRVSAMLMGNCLTRRTSLLLQMKGRRSFRGRSLQVTLRRLARGEPLQLPPTGGLVSRRQMVELLGSRKRVLRSLLLSRICHDFGPTFLGLVRVRAKVKHWLMLVPRRLGRNASKYTERKSSRFWNLLMSRPTLVLWFSIIVLSLKLKTRVYLMRI